MRRTRTLAVGLAAAALALPASALGATDAGTTQATTATVNNTLTATFPADPIALTLAPGTNSSPGQSVNVKSNLAWGLRVFADHSPLAKWDGAEYVAGSLANPLTVAVDGGSAASVSESANSTGVSNLVAKDDTDARAAGDAGTTLSLVFNQDFSYADAPGDYRGVITYAADQAFNAPAP